LGDVPPADGYGVTAASVLVLEAPGKLVEDELEIPDLRPGQALLKVEACGLCGSDHEMFSGAMPANLPLVPGHEVIGSIVSASPEYLAARSMAVGDRVALEVFQRCGVCDPCAVGAYTLCRRHGLQDSYGNTGLHVGAGLWGGYASHLLLTEDSIVQPVPGALDPVVATLFNPLGAGIRWGVTLPEVKPGDVVAVLGPGLRGLSAVLAADVAGAGFVLLTGAGSRDAARLAMGRALGASLALDVFSADVKAELKKHTGGLADVVVDVTAAAPAAFTQALDLVRPGGTVVVAGTRGRHVIENFNPDRIVFKEIKLLGARGVDGVAYRAALDLLASDDRLTRIPRKTAPLSADSVAALLDEMASGLEPPLHSVVVP